MSSDKKKSLVHKLGTELTGSSKRSNPVRKRMTQDVLTRAESRGVSQTRYRIGDYELREPDYLQICDWAAAMNIAPETLLDTFRKTYSPAISAATSSDIVDNSRFTALAIENGAIVSLVWDFERLPHIPVAWRNNLLIKTLGFVGDWPDQQTVLKPHLPKLEWLLMGQETSHYGFPEPLQMVGKLDLSSVPSLTKLICNYSYLGELDLSPVPRLTILHCPGNKLKKLDLRPVSRLTSLNCGSNALTELDLSSVPGLVKLGCAHNKINELNLSPLPKLTELNCFGCNLDELDLTPVPELIYLECGLNDLNRLDLTPVPKLKTLRCSSNNLTKLDLSPVPALYFLNCESNKLAELDLTPVVDLDDYSLMCDQETTIVRSSS